MTYYGDYDYRKQSSDSILKDYGARVEPSQRRMRRSIPVSQFMPTRNDPYGAMCHTMEEVPCVDIVMPQDKYTEFCRMLELTTKFDKYHLHHLEKITNIAEEVDRETEKRKNSPAAQAAYEKYKLLLSLS